MCRNLGISEASYNRWKAQCGEIEGGEAGRLRELERENVRLKRIMAAQTIDITILGEAGWRNY